MSDEPSPADERKERRKQLKKLRERLALERESWSRWMPRLRRSFKAIDATEKRIRKLERQIAALDAN